MMETVATNFVGLTVTDCNADCSCQYLNTPYLLFPTVIYFRSVDGLWESWENLFEFNFVLQISNTTPHHDIGQQWAKKIHQWSQMVKVLTNQDPNLDSGLIFRMWRDTWDLLYFTDSWGSAHGVGHPAILIVLYS